MWNRKRQPQQQNQKKKKENVYFSRNCFISNYSSMQNFKLNMNQSFDNSFQLWMKRVISVFPYRKQLSVKWISMCQSDTTTKSLPNIKCSGSFVEWLIWIRKSSYIFELIEHKAFEKFIYLTQSNKWNKMYFTRRKAAFHSLDWKSGSSPPMTSWK